MQGRCFALAQAINEGFLRKILSYFWGEVVDISGVINEKSGGERASEIDLRIQNDFRRFVVENTHIPQHPVISEEDCSEWPPRDSCVWVIDPFDGTHSFLMGLPSFGVGIFLIENGRIAFSIIFLPSESFLRRKSVYFAAEEEGAWKQVLGSNGGPSRIFVSKNRRLAESTLFIDGPSRILAKSKLVRVLSQNVAKVRYPSSAMWGSTRVAAANTLPLPADLYLNMGSKPWDNLPGALLVQEAGGVAVSLDGSPYSIKNYETLLYGNRALVQEALRLVNRREA